MLYIQIITLVINIFLTFKYYIYQLSYYMQCSINLMLWSITITKDVVKFLNYILLIVQLYWYIN